MNNRESEERYQGQRPARKRRRMGGATGVLLGMIIGAVLCMAVFTIGAVKSKALNTEMDSETKVNLILSYLSQYYIDDLDEETIETALARGLMENIGDKYARYYTEEEFASLIETVSGEYAGIGVLITQGDDGSIIVYQVYDDSPALEAGIQVMDVIVEAAGRRDFETLDDLVSVVKGEAGTTVDIVIKRGDEEIPMTVERRQIEVKCVGGVMLDDTLGYIQIAEFNPAMVQQFNDTVDKLLSEGAQELIIDLRDNPGGDYDAVVAVCDRVVPEGAIVTVENRKGGVATENSDPESLDVPMVLLVNGNTASAAELFTMCLHDYDKAQIVGTTTYGKGIVQSIYRLLDGSGIKFTTERYYGPAGECIQDTGIEPDYLVEIPEEAYADGVVYGWEDTQLNKAAELLGHTLVFDDMPQDETASEETAASEEATE